MQLSQRQGLRQKLTQKQKLELELEEELTLEEEREWWRWWRGRIIWDGCVGNCIALILQQIVPGRGKATNYPRRKSGRQIPPWHGRTMEEIADALVDAWNTGR